MTLKVIRTQNISIKESLQRWVLNFTDIVLNANKFYTLEIVKDNHDDIYLYTNYGRLGSNPVQEYRKCLSFAEAEKEANKIIKSKTKKGYQEVKLIQASVGSEVGKAKIEIPKVSIEDLEKNGVKIVEENPSNLHKEVQNLVSTWFGISSEFVDANFDTKKCPLGQLSIDQITKAKNILSEISNLINNKFDTNEANKLTSLYYSNIPCKFVGRKIDADSLRFDSHEKVSIALDNLDVLADMKNAEKVISKKSNVDDKYNSLNSTIDFVDPTSDVFKWINDFFLSSRASNHGFLGNLKIERIFKLKRNNEDEVFFRNAEVIAKSCKKFNPAPLHKNFASERPDLSKEEFKIYKKANILPLFHGTRRANLVGITTRGFLIRPPGTVINGAMYGNSIYHGFSSKAINYVDISNSYWARGGTDNTGYLFLTDCILGEQLIANGPYNYTPQNIKPHHSVWARGGHSGVINDEFMLYHATGENQQHRIRYVIEFKSF